MASKIGAVAARCVAIAAACASVSMLLTARAEAACTPAAGNDVSAVCTGATAGGYGGAGFTNLNVTVDTGATVTAGAASITFNTGSLLNRGTVSGVTSGVLGATATITNSALIFASGGTAIDLSGSLTLTNSGSVQGSQNGVRAATATIANSGLIVGTSGQAISLSGFGDITNSGNISGNYGILSFSTVKLANRGLVYGDNAALSVNGATIDNSGTILSGGTAVDSAGATIANRGTISGASIGIGTSGFTLNLDNSGSVSGQFGIFTNVGNIVNSGTISGTGGTAIDAFVNLALVNSGVISGQTTAIFAPTAAITNSGSIAAATAAAIDVTALTLANSGSISGVTSGVHGATATIANSGSITATGGPGIDLSGSLKLTNSGLVRGNSDGLSAASATIVNSGSIVGNLRAINLVGAGDITNSGSISGGSYGIASFSGVKLVNSGTVSGSVSAVSVSSATIDNSGAILSNSVAIDAGIAAINNSGTIAGRGIAITTVDLTLFNTGTVSVSDPGASAIYALRADISNAGLIAAANISSLAISLSSAADTLTSFAGSRIIGRIDLGGGADRVDFRGGNFNYTFNSLAGVTVTSAGPYIVQGSRVVTVDPTPFAATNRNILAFSAAVTSALPLAEPPPPAARPAMSYATAVRPAQGAREAFAAVMTPQGPTAVYGGGVSMWARGFAGERDQSATGPLLHTVNRFQGGFIGGDWQANPFFRLGAFVGAGAMRSTEDLNLNGVSSDVAFGGAFARGTFGDTFLDMMIQLGRLSGHSSRVVSNNLAPTGIETALGDYAGLYAIPELGLGRHIELGEMGGTTWRLTPVGRIRYLAGNLGGYNESASTASLTVGGRRLSELEERAELKLSGTIRSADFAVITGSLRVGVLGAQRVGGAAVNATLLGQAIPFATPGADTIWGVLGGGGLELSRGAASFFVSGDYLKASDSSVVYGGRGGLRLAF